jgi:hypothetical protein
MSTIVWKLLIEASAELRRLRDVLLPMYEGKIAEPDLELIERIDQAIIDRVRRDYDGAR